MLVGKKVILRAVARDELSRIVEFENDLEVYALAGFSALWKQRRQ